MQEQISKLQGPESRHTTQAAREAIWQNIANRVNAVGVVHRTRQDIRKWWNDIKRWTKDKLGANRASATATGGGQAATMTLTTVKEHVSGVLTAEQVSGIPAGVNTGRVPPAHETDKATATTRVVHRGNPMVLQAILARAPPSSEEDDDEVEEEVVVLEDVEAEDEAMALCGTGDIGHEVEVEADPKDTASMATQGPAAEQHGRRKGQRRPRGATSALPPRRKRQHPWLRRPAGVPPTPWETDMLRVQGHQNAIHLANRNTLREGLLTVKSRMDKLCEASTLPVARLPRQWQGWLPPVRPSQQGSRSRWGAQQP